MLSDVSNGRLEWGCGFGREWRGERESERCVVLLLLGGVSQRPPLITDKQYNDHERPSCWSFCFGSQRLEYRPWRSSQPAAITAGRRVHWHKTGGSVRKWIRMGSGLLWGRCTLDCRRVSVLRIAGSALAVGRPQAPGCAALANKLTRVDSKASRLVSLSLSSAVWPGVVYHWPNVSHLDGRLPSLRNIKPTLRPPFARFLWPTRAATAAAAAVRRRRELSSSRRTSSRPALCPLLWPSTSLSTSPSPSAFRPHLYYCRSTIPSLPLGARPLLSSPATFSLSFTPPKTVRQFPVQSLTCL